jgi:uncharacterized repeat protein (TIGR03803 family)
MRTQFGVLFLAAALDLLCLGAIHAASPTLTTLYSFKGYPEGTGPRGSLIFDGNGALYGVTAAGGSDPLSGSGTIFRLSPPVSPGGTWTETVLHSFHQNGGGWGPVGGLALGRNGTLYGTTNFGGTSGAGVAFALVPPAFPGSVWIEHVLHAFTRGLDGGVPTAGVIIRLNGEVLGTASVGGTFSQGTVYKLTPPTVSGAGYAESVLFDFSADVNGSPPGAFLVGAKDGTIYGTTFQGPAQAKGTVYQLVPPSTPGNTWTQNILYTFTGQNGDGASPNGVVVGEGGALYGTTLFGGTSTQCYDGCGTVFSLTPQAPGTAWTERVLYSFQGGNGDGASPITGVLIGRNGVIYGTTQYGGPGPVGCCGTVFGLVPPATPGGAWIERLLHIFGGADGSVPVGGLIFGLDGALYGTTSTGGTTGYGTVFKLTL